MLRKTGFASFSVAALISLIGILPIPAQAQTGSQAVPVITQTVDETKLVRLKGNTRPEAKVSNDRGRVADNVSIDHMLLQLRRPAQQERDLELFIAGLHDPGSPNFHQWLTPTQFGERFGPAQQDLDTIRGWLESHGFKVNLVYPSGMLIDFSGTAGEVRAAFHTEIHQLQVRGVTHMANMQDPQIPAALAPAIAGIVSLNDFRPRAMVKLKPQFNFTDIFGQQNYAVVPGDLATIYNFNPLFSSGISGQGQTIVVIEDGNVFSTADWTTFRSTFGLSGYTSGSFTQVHPAPPSGPSNCSNPGVVGTSTNPIDAEAILDAEYASAAAPSAAIQLASCSDTTTTFGGLIALQNLINSTSPAPPAIVSISYGECEAVNGAAANAAYNSTYQQADAEGVSVYVAAGDSGASGCDNGAAEATSGIAVSAFASTPYNVAVGGTDFSDTYAGANATYWNSANTASFASALSYVPEIPWNDSCTSALFAAYEGYPVYGAGSLCNSLLGLLDTTAAGSGGPSGCATGAPSTSGVVSGSCAGYPKPSWQQVFGNPCGVNCGTSANDAVRDIPDVSLFAADGLWYHEYIFCWSDTANGGAACGADPSAWVGAGGTSFASPIMAGVQALINQKTGSRQGNPNPAFYNLANTEYGTGGNPGCNANLGNAISSSCIFHDVTLGDMAVVCVSQTLGTFNCYDAADGDGILSTSNTALNLAYGTTPGWDFATGIGSINVAGLVNSWPNLNAAVLSITKTHTGNFAQGQQNVTYTVVVSNGPSAAATSGTVTVTETAPAGLTLVSMAGTGWTCTTNTCTRSDSLSAGTSYPAITVNMNVAANASSPQVNQVSVSGGGSASANASDSTTITTGTGAVVSFANSDTTTQGNWRAAYGADGYSIANDSQAIPSYASFAVQNQLSWTWTANTTDPRALQTGSGAGRIASAWYANPSFGFDVNFTDGKSHQFALYALDWDSTMRAETIQVVDANTQAILDTRSISGFHSGIYLIWNISGHVRINITRTAGVNAVVSGVFFGGKPTATSAVSFVNSDTTTAGSWHGVYGADGYSVANDSQLIPSYASLALQNQLSWTWTTNTTDPRALQTGSGAGRIASAWYSPSGFALDLNLTDGKTHQFALYAVDWDTTARAETIQVVDANTQAILDTRSISGFHNGIYLIWNISGHVRITVTRTAGVNAVVSGIFFGGSPSASTASFLNSDTTTEGTWHGVYGADGYSVANDTQSIPSYAAFAVQRQLNYTWAASTTDPRALQTGSGTGRIAATWYKNPGFSFDVNFTDGNAHQFAIYAVDWDSTARVETIQVVDANTQAILDTRSISGFHSGIYLVWNISGHVRINVTLTAGVNAVISGAFFK